MSALSQQELAKVRKAAEESVTLSNEMKQSFVDEKIRSLNVSIKKLLMRKDATLEILVVRGAD